MKYFYLLPVLLGLSVIPIEFAYASDSTSLRQLTFDNKSIKKRCCYQATVKSYYITQESMGYAFNKESPNGIMVYTCTDPANPALGPNQPADESSSMVSLSTFGDASKDFPNPDVSSWAKRPQYIRCVKRATVCGYANADVQPPYNETNCIK